MIKPKLTPWFPGTVKPARGVEHIGPYLRQFDYDEQYSWWNGREWMFAAGVTPGGACRALGPSTRQNLPWRGLAEKP